MQKTKLALSLTFVATFLTACGGSGGSDSDSSGGKKETTDPNIEAISGIYSTSMSGDTGYTYIAKSGEVTAYDYQGDAVGNGNNCYTVATASTQVNGALTGSVITYSESSDEYSVEFDDNTLTFKHDDTEGLKGFVFNQLLSMPNGLSISLNGMKLFLKGNAVSNVQIEDITGSICD